MPKINGVKKFIYLGKKKVIFLSKKLFKEKSTIDKIKKREPRPRKRLKFSLLGFKKLIFFIFYFSFIAILLLYQFINKEIAKLILK